MLFKVCPWHDTLLYGSIGRGGGLHAVLSRHVGGATVVEGPADASDWLEAMG